MKSSITIGMVCTGDSGHLYPTLSLAIELRRRGYKVIFYQNEDGRKKIEKYGFMCTVYGTDKFPEGVWDSYQRELSKLKGFRANLYAGLVNAERVLVALRDLPELIKNDGVSFLIVDQVSLEAVAVAELLKIPHMTLMSCIPMQASPSLPPFYSGLIYGTSPSHLERFSIKYNEQRIGFMAQLSPVNKFRKQHNLSVETAERFGMSEYGQICQLTKSFDFPREYDPVYKKYYCGLLYDSEVIQCEFPFERLNGLPLIYCSFGTLQNGLSKRFRAVINACKDMNVQLVISLGGNEEIALNMEIPENVIIVKFAPQHKLLEIADLFISHCGLGGVMQSLSRGTPILAMPIATDQPGVAARIHWSGVGRIVRIFTSAHIKKLIHEILNGSKYQKAAKKISEEIAEAGGVSFAVDVIEEKLGQTLIA